MSVSVRSSASQYKAAVTERTPGQVLRNSAANNIMNSSRHSMTEQRLNGRQRTHSQAGDLKNTAVISIDELQRIRQQCTQNSFPNTFNSSGYDMEEEQQRTRQELQEKSKARIAQWPNTIQAMRKKREEERIRRLEEEELERRRIDAMEYELQQQTRIRAVERANKHAYEAQDQVKSFHSKLLMSDVLAEREIQHALKKRKQEQEKKLEKEWEELDVAKMEAFDEKVRQKLIDEYGRKMANSKVISDQLNEFKMKYIKRLQDEKLEAELIMRQVQEEMQREAEKEAERKKKQIQQKETFRKANQDLILQQQEEKRKEIEEGHKIEEYARKKDALDQLKKDKEESKFQEKQKTRQMLIERQAEILRNMKNREDEILNKQFEEAEEKALRLFEEQERRRQQLKDAIERSRAQQKERKQKEKEQELQDQREFSHFWKLRNEELHIAEQQEKEEARLRDEEMKGYLKQQIEIKRRKAEEEFKSELQLATKTQALLDQQEKSFLSYAEQALKEWQSNGKNVKPLILELKSYKKKVF